MDENAGAAEEKPRVGDRAVGGGLEEQQQQSLVEALSQAVYESLPDEVKPAAMARLDLDDDDLTGDQAMVSGAMGGSIVQAYPGIDKKIRRAATAAATAKLKKALDRPQPSQAEAETKSVNRMATAFRAPYIGNVHVKFGNYLCKCWGRCETDAKIFPYVTVTQSSGFGKSRMLHELAKTCARRDSVRDAASLAREKSRDTKTQCSTSVQIRVLYVCARESKNSTGYPVVTPKLNEWFFDEPDNMVERLLTAFAYAEANWDSVAAQWPSLFDTTSADATVHAALDGYVPSGVTDASAIRPDDNPRQAKQRRVATDSAPTRTQAQTELAHSNSGDLSEFAKIAISGVKPNEAPSRRNDKRTSDSGRVLVFVVDEARSLLRKKTRGKDGEDGKEGEKSYFRHLRAALRDANESLTRSGKRGVFGVFVDTSSRIHDFVPPAERDPSAREEGKHFSSLLFAPFVLTHTMDTYLECSALQEAKNYDYKANVKATITKVPETEGEGSAGDWKYDPELAWGSLVSMGRPLWKCCIDDIENADRHQAMALGLAASKLLCGDPITELSSYERNMGGVAAVFCRLGLRPRAYSSMASYMVADFMAVLGYVAYAYDAHICNYPSEPILAFGAARLWYTSVLNDKCALATHMLPQFEEMLRQETVDTGNVGEIVARIILLLAMDSTVIQGLPRPKKGDEAFRFMGQFCSVKRFLQQLAGGNPELHNIHAMATADEKDAFSAWLGKWDKWKVGFSQFFELRAKPMGKMTDKTLWFLLGRRAAAVLPRNQTGADLLIPMFCEDAVSFILVQVKNRYDSDRGFPETATRKLTPSYVFGSHRPAAKVPKPPHPFTKKKPIDMIRIYMTLRECFEAPISRAEVNMTPPGTAESKSADSEETVTSPKRQYRGARYFLMDKSKPTETSYSLVLRGMCRTPKNDRKLSEKKQEWWPFLDPVSSALEKIANTAWWDPIDRVEADLSKRADVNATSTVHMMIREDLVDDAKRTLVQPDAYEYESAGDKSTVRGVEE